jgi:hypothetical protein
MTDVDIVLHVNSAGEAENIEQEIVRFTGVDASTVTAMGPHLRAKLPQASLADVARLEPVQGILPELWL